MVVREVLIRAGAFGLLVLSLIAAPGGVLAAGPATDLEALARRLTAPATQKQALAEAAEVADPALEALLRALKEGGLYLYKGRPVLLADDGTIKDVAGGPILEVGQPASLPSGQEAVALDESLFEIGRAHV